MSSPRIAASRRTVLVGAVGMAGIALTGCAGSEPAPSAGGAVTPATGPARADGGDDALVARTTLELASLATLVHRVAERHHDLRSQLAPLSRLHAAHLQILGGRVSHPRDGVRVPAGSAAAYALVRRREDLARRHLAAGALAADSGELAQLLASMSAALGQRVALLRGAS